MNSEKNDTIKIGIDYRDGQYYAARIDQSSGRIEVKALVRFDIEHFHDHPLLKASNYIFSVPDNKVILKKISIAPDEPDFNLKASFELSQRVMVNEDNCYFDTIKTALESKTIGLLLRKKHLLDIAERFNFNSQTEEHITGGEMRAAAMAKGYLNFCKLSDGELICLADFGKESISIAFIYRNKILDLTFLWLEKIKLDDHIVFEKVAIELKTLVNFKLASFFDEGITVPLSTLLVIGDYLDDNRISVLSRFFQSKVKKPEIHSGFFAPEHNLSEIPLEKYLTALGLTVN